MIDEIIEITGLAETTSKENLEEWYQERVF